MLRGIFALSYAVEYPEVVNPDNFVNWAEYTIFTGMFMDVGVGTLFRELFGCPGDIEDPR